MSLKYVLDSLYLHTSFSHTSIYIHTYLNKMYIYMYDPHIILKIVLYINCFHYNILCRGSILVMSVWCPGGLLYLNKHLFLNIFETSWYYFVDYITYTFAMHLFFFFVPMIVRFGVFMEMQSTCIFLLQLLSLCV
jgi:hypothetical protein